MSDGGAAVSTAGKKRLGFLRGAAGGPPRGLVTWIRILAVVALVAAALATPGFTAAPSVYAMLTTLSFIGCVAIGMTFITISGNIMSFALGATAAATSLVFVGVLESAGVGPAIVAALAFGGLVTAAQGFVIGYIRANPIIVSIAALALIFGAAQLITDGASLYTMPGSGHEILKGRFLGLPVEFVLFLVVVALGHFLLVHTRFGQNVYMVGSSLRAAEIAGVRTWRTVLGAYFAAGLFTAVPGIMLAARYNAANMEYGIGYDYDAIAAVLVGGTAIQGGLGSVLRTLVGVVIIATVQVILLLQGFRQEWQYLITGLIVLGVIMLHTVENKR